MSVKLEDWKTALSQANYAWMWTSPADKNYSKICYWVALSYNGLEQPDEALKILEEIIKDTKDP